jgi:ABC-type glycerol-3-phosphate transport system substrate-binding protein
MKKALTILLALLMLLTAFASVSCGDTSGMGDATTVASVNSEGPEQTDSDTTPRFREANYNGQDFTIYLKLHANYNSEYISAEETNGDLMNDSTWARNLLVEQTYNVKLSFMDDKNPCSRLKNDIAGGDCPYDIIFDSRTDMSDHIATGELTDFRELDCDITTDWWDTRFISDLSINGKTYMMLSDLSVARFAGLRFLYFNKQLIDNYHLIQPYTYLADNTWTLENFLNLVKGVRTDPTSSEFGTYGLVLETGEANGVYMHMIVGCGLSYSGFDAEGNLICTLSDNISKIDSAFDQMRVVFQDKECVLTMDESDARDASIHGTKHGEGNNKYSRARSMFAQGHYLFTHTSIAQATIFSETMTDDFGCMPNPKYNLDQEEYSHKSDPYTVCFAIPKAANIDLERVATVLDYWSYISNEYTISTYYDITIKSKKVKESTASEVVDIVKKTAHYELIDVFEVSGVTAAIQNGYQKGNITQQIQSYNRTINFALNKLNKAFKGE